MFQIKTKQVFRMPRSIRDAFEKKTNRACIRIISILLLLKADSSASPPPPPPRNCTGTTNGISTFGAEPYTIFHCTNITTCCALCAANETGCGAYFAKIASRPDSSEIKVNGRGANLNECHLYDPVAAAHLRKGNCPHHGGPKHVCGSAIWVSPAPSPSPSPTPPTPPAPAPRPSVVELMVNGTAAWTISPYLASMSLVYEWAPDYLYNTSINGSVTRWAKKHRINIARYPAGQSSFWNWEHPSGYMGISSFDPTAPPQAPSQDWMSLAEYLQLCEEIGSQPLIGVNYFCSAKHRSYCGSLNESIAHAVKQVEYVVARGFPGAFYYIGNEECQTDCSGFHANLIAQHARAMKQADPTIKTFFSSNEIRPGSLERVMRQVGVGLLDGVDLHGKWPKGGGGGAVTWDHYMTEVPLLDHKCKESWRARLAGLRNVTLSLGRPDFMLMNNEFGLGKPGSYKGRWNRYQKALAAIEFNMELHIAGFDVACMWDNGAGYHTPDGKWHCANCGNNGEGVLTSDHMLLSALDEKTGAHLPLDQYRLNPVHHGMEMLSQAQNQTMLHVNSSGYRLHGFASRNASGVIKIFLINKYNGTSQKVRLTLPQGAMAPSSVITLEDDVDTTIPGSEHWGVVRSPQKLSCAQNVCEFELPPLSFSMLTG